MKFEKLKSIIMDMANDKFEFENNPAYEEQLLSLAGKNLKHKEIIRIRRRNRNISNWKTIVLIEIVDECNNGIKVELKKAISWLASVKQSLLGVEGADLYLFLAFNVDIDIEECLRIESTEQFCKKYVLLPNEEIMQFINRTFLQSLEEKDKTIQAGDPIERAFSETANKFDWLTTENQKVWKRVFLDSSGSELADILLGKGGDMA